MDQDLCRFVTNLVFISFSSYLCTYSLDYKRETNEDIEKKKLKRRWENEIDRLKKQQRAHIADVQKTGKVENGFLTKMALSSRKGVEFYFLSYFT